MASSTRIAVLMTCHNRKSETLNALAALFRQEGLEGFSLSVYLVDDGSTDGTADAIRLLYPHIAILQGTGHLFWTGGMRLAFAAAVQQDYDYHLWLNDDTVLDPSALKTLLVTVQTLKEAGFDAALVSGSTCDSQTQALVSGGFQQPWPRALMRFRLLEPQNQALRCDTISGNCVLAPRVVYQAVGNFSPAFTHFLGDLDYGLRSQRAGYTLWIAPGFVGTSPQHHGRGNEVYTLPCMADLGRRLWHPKGLNFGDDLQQRFLPIPEWTAFLQHHGGIFWLLPWLLTYRKLFSLLLGRWLWRSRSSVTPQPDL